MDSDPEEISNIEEQHEAEEVQRTDDDGNEGGHVEVERDEADEGGEKKLIKPKRVVRNPQPKLNAERLKGPKGLTALPAVFAKQKFKGKHHEKEDTRALLKSYAYWCHRMFPKYPFEECVEKIERLGSKKAVITHITKIRLGMIQDEINETPPESDEETQPTPNVESQFDNLLEIRPVTQPPVELTEEQRERIRINKEKALLLRQERLKRIQEQAESKLLPSSHLPTSEFQQNLQDDISSEVVDGTSSENVVMLENDSDNEENVASSAEKIIAPEPEKNFMDTSQDKLFQNVSKDVEHEIYENSTLEPEPTDNINISQNKMINNIIEEDSENETTNKDYTKEDCADDSQHSMIIGHHTRNDLSVEKISRSLQPEDTANVDSIHSSQESTCNLENDTELEENVDGNVIRKDNNLQEGDNENQSTKERLDVSGILTDLEPDIFDEAMEFE